MHAETHAATRWESIHQRLIELIGVLDHANTRMLRCRASHVMPLLLQGFADPGKGIPDDQSSAALFRERGAEATEPGTDQDEEIAAGLGPLVEPGGCSTLRGLPRAVEAICRVSGQLQHGFATACSFDRERQLGRRSSVGHGAFMPRAAAGA